MTPDHEELLIHRAIELSASPADWTEIESLARRDPGVWQRLAAGLRDQGELLHAVEPELDRAERVVLPAARPRRVTTLLPWSGWAAAALLAVCWVAGLLAVQGGPDGSANMNVPRTPPDDGVVSLDQLQLVSTDVVGELPSMMIETLPAADGNGYDVIYLRRTLERVQVDGLYQLAEDEHGNPTPGTTRWTPPAPLERM